MPAFLISCQKADEQTAAANHDVLTFFSGYTSLKLSEIRHFCPSLLCLVAEMSQL
jgi:hypothetical protein